MSIRNRFDNRFRIGWLWGDCIPLGKDGRIPVDGELVKRIDNLVISFFEKCLGHFESLWLLIFIAFIASCGLLANILLPWSWNQEQPWQLIGVIATLVITATFCLGVFETWYPAQLREHVRLGGKIARRVNNGGLNVVSPQRRR